MAPQVKSKNHYRFCDSREILLFGEDVYAAPITADFDPEGYRYGAVRLMRKEQWDQNEQGLLKRYPEEFKMEDTTFVYYPEGQPVSDNLPT